jgi:O-6-methylguanine DNA methyltransferase
MTFRQKVDTVVFQIPRGQVLTYGQVARLAGRPKAARAVGYFMKTNSDMTKVPCHRVVGSNGKLVGYSGPGGLAAKKKLLLEEGVKFKTNSLVCPMK